MPRFEPFRAVRYDPGRVDLDLAASPPYDVIGPDERRALAARSPYNAVHVDVVENLDDGYEQARCQFRRWLDEGVLRLDDEPGFYAYAMGFTDTAGLPRQTLGVVGALDLAESGSGDVLPHERTMSKAKDDRLRLLRACRANLSPVWCLSLAGGLTALCADLGPPVARCTDEDGVHHRLWRIVRPGVVGAIADVVAGAPVVIADGHHRYETALAFRDELRAEGDATPDADLLMAFVVELDAGQVDVRPIHRLVEELPPGADLLGAMATAFAPTPLGDDVDLADDRCRDTLAGPVLVTAAGRWLLTPTGAQDDPDSVRIEQALATVGSHRLRFDHRAAAVLAAAATDGTAGLLLRPMTVTQIAAAARRGQRLPQKTTFFAPKPRTGMLFRPLG